MTDSAERKQLAYLNYAVGRKARGAAAPDVAVHYLKAALELLGQEGWTTDYEIVCPAHLIRAECEYLSGNLEGAFALLQAVEHNARPVHAAGVNHLDALAKRAARVDDERAAEGFRERELRGEGSALPREDWAGSFRPSATRRPLGRPSAPSLQPIKPH